MTFGVMAEEPSIVREAKARLKLIDLKHMNERYTSKGNQYDSMICAQMVEPSVILQWTGIATH